MKGMQDEGGWCGFKGQGVGGATVSTMVEFVDEYLVC